MTVTLDDIQLMWSEDSKINIDDLHNEALKSSLLHSKYYQYYNNFTLLRKKIETDYKKKKLERYNYYAGKADPEVYKTEPFPYKVREKDGMQRHLESDEILSKYEIKIEYYNTVLKFLEEIIKNISNRNYQIKNSIDYLKFISGN